MENCDLRQSMLGIAGLPVLLRSSDPDFWPFADRRYRNFYIPQDRRPEEIIDIVVAEDSAASPGRIGAATTRIEERNGAVVMHRGNAVGEWDRRLHRGRLVQPRTDFAPPAQYADYGCDSFLRVILSFRLLESGGLLVHASGLVRNGNGFLFAGRSGAGKSTVARLSSGDCLVLSDDLTLASPPGAGGTIFGTPFFGDFGAAGSNVGAPLKGICFLRQAPFARATRLSPAAAVQRLLPSVVSFSRSREAMAAVLGAAQDLCTRVPCYDLDFTQDVSFWRHIDG